MFIRHWINNTIHLVLTSVPSVLDNPLPAVRLLPPSLPQPAKHFMPTTAIFFIFFQYGFTRDLKLPSLLSYQLRKLVPLPVKTTNKQTNKNTSPCCCFYSSRSQLVGQLSTGEWIAPSSLAQQPMPPEVWPTDLLYESAHWPTYLSRPTDLLIWPVWHALLFLSLR